jgi:hypothetical protein
MIKDQKVTLGGKEIKNVREISITCDTPADVKGFYREPTQAVTINIIRDASDHPIVDLFDMATNVDGRKIIQTSGVLEFHGDDVKDQYKFELKRWHICNWTLSNPSTPNAPTLESIQIKCGHIEYNAPDGGAEFELPTFK